MRREVVSEIRLMMSRRKVFGQLNPGAPGIGEEGNFNVAIGHLVNRLVELDAIRFQILDVRFQIFHLEPM